MELSAKSAAILLFIIMDPFGNIPLFVPLLERVAAERRQFILLREILIAFAVLATLLMIGPILLSAMHLSTDSLQIAGGIILFLIALKMVFGGSSDMFGDVPDGEPLIVPLAIPYIAGPSSVAMVLLLSGQTPERRLNWLLALFIASVANAVVLLAATRLAALMGQRLLSAIERLMGLVLTAIAVEVFLNGLRAFNG